jgi:hypothetical protein
MAIVTYVHRPPKRQKQGPQARPAAGPAIVTAAPKRQRGPKAPDDRPVDPEVAAWFARNVRPPGT